MADTAFNVKTIWLSWDLGIDGDYEKLYFLLDQLKAKECGDNLAVIKYKISKDQDLIEEFLSELEIIDLKKDDRFYLIYRENKKIKGKFILGKRKKKPAWEGYAEEYFEEIEEIDE